MNNLRAYPILTDKYETRPGCGSLEQVWRVWTPFESPHVVGEFQLVGGAQALADLLNQRGMQSVSSTCPTCQAEIITLPGMEPPPLWECPQCGGRFSLLSTIAGVIAISESKGKESPQPSHNPDQMTLF